MLLSGYAGKWLLIGYMALLCGNAANGLREFMCEQLRIRCAYW